MPTLRRIRGNLQTPSNFPAIDEIATSFWGQSCQRKNLINGQANQCLDMSAYEDYFQRTWCAMAADADGRYVATKAMTDIFQIVSSLLNGHERDAVVAQLKQKHIESSSRTCERSVDLTVRLLLMLKVGIVRHQIPPNDCLDWAKGSLADFVQDCFPKTQVLDCHHVRLPKAFDAWSISAIGGLKIKFTDNLADHLRLVEDDTIVLVFHYASFLECQENSIFPDQFVNETLRTLALLFPQAEFGSSRRGANRKRAWFQKLCSESTSCLVDSRATLCGNLRTEDRQIERFTYWRDRLIMIKQVYDDATPHTIKQWWYDRRNGERWFTFWVAVTVLVITIVLGVIQSVASLLQVYKAFYPTQT
ncbi:hypothetical protein F5Y16DRAFT_114780 [Xylariaceae sp. FL0255]|nr:hypothetical protein F5Y16DRAFT_114780 [Xylariaceae sp. FL0255]